MTMIEKVSLALRDMGNCVCRECLGKRVRAAIEAMREPTEVMENAGYAEWSHGTGGFTSEIWRAMIDAALEEKQGKKP